MPGLKGGDVKRTFDLFRGHARLYLFTN